MSLNKMTSIIIDGDACPVIQSVIELTSGTGIFVIIVRSFSHYTTQTYPEHVNTIYVDDGPDAVDYKIVQLAQSKDIVITQDYGLASLLLNKVKTVLHHKGYIYNSTNIDMLIQQRYNHAQLRKQGGRHKGPTPFSNKDQQHFEHIFRRVLSQI